MLISRAFAILAAIFLVVAFSLFMLTPEDLSLLQGLNRVNPGWLTHLHDGVRHGLGNAVWARAVVPVLARPVWLVPLCLGMICVGVASSSAGAADAGERSRRRS